MTATRRPYIDGGRLPADHPLAPRLRSAGEAAAQAMRLTLSGLDGLAYACGMVVLRDGDDVWIAHSARRRGIDHWSPVWSPAAVRAMGEPRTARQAINLARRLAEVAEWMDAQGRLPHQAVTQ